MDGVKVVYFMEDFMSLLLSVPALIAGHVIVSSQSLEDLQTQVAFVQDLSQQLNDHRRALMGYGRHKADCPGDSACNCGWSVASSKLHLPPVR